MELQEERDEIYKEMIVYKEKIEYYKEANNALEKEKKELLAFKASTPQQDPSCTTKNLAEAMFDLSLKRRN